jgi:hypothetical protein
LYLGVTQSGNDGSEGDETLDVFLKLVQVVLLALVDESVGLGF